LPIIVIDLPPPPSANRLWRSIRGKVIKSREYREWISVAGGHWLQQKPASALKSIDGYYTLKIVISRSLGRRRDIGNFEKGISDLLQALRIIENDNLCEELHLVRGDETDAPLGTRIFIEGC
jgi:crossover junction endodeoxyribonuclease RusA